MCPHPPSLAALLLVKVLLVILHEDSNMSIYDFAAISCTVVSIKVLLVILNEDLA